MPQEYFYYAPHVGNKPNEDRRSVAKMLYNSGLSLRSVADKMGITFQAVHALLKRSGVTMRSKGGRSGSHSRHKK